MITIIVFDQEPYTIITKATKPTMSRHPRYPFVPSGQTTYRAPASLLEEMEHPQVPMHLTDTGGFYSSSEANQCVLLRPRHSEHSLGQLFHEHTATPIQVGIDETKIPSDFPKRLKEFVGHLAECKQRCGLSEIPPERRNILEGHAHDGDSPVARVQALIEVDEGAMQSGPFREGPTSRRRPGTHSRRVSLAPMTNCRRRGI